MSKLEESAFGLSEDELAQIRYLEIMKKRRAHTAKPRFSDRLSVEAQIAMQLTLDEMRVKRSKTTVNKKEEPGRRPSGETKKQYRQGEEVWTPKPPLRDSGDFDANGIHAVETDHSQNQSDRLHGLHTFSDSYEKRRSPRMGGDITDTRYNPNSDNRKGLGGVKLESAMEITEIIRHGEVENSPEDDRAIELIALQNSVEKVTIWMDMNPEPSQLNYDVNE